MEKVARWKWHVRGYWNPREDRIPSIVWLGILWIGMLFGFVRFFRHRHIDWGEAVGLRRKPPLRAIAVGGVFFLAVLPPVAAVFVVYAKFCSLVGIEDTPQPIADLMATSDSAIVVGLIAVFAVIEHLNKSELTTTSKKLLIAYVDEASELTAVEKARSAVRRYTQIALPTLDRIREKSRTGKLDALDHLVLKLEYEASRLPS